MAESKARKKATYTAPPRKTSGPKPNPVWYMPVVIGLLLIGLVWIVVTYFLQGNYPIPGLGNWNLLIGFGIMLVGFGMLTRWR